MGTIVEQKELFETVQLSGIFKDSKTFPDMIACRNMEEIISDFEVLRNNDTFELKKFVTDNFSSVIPEEKTFVTSNTDSAENHILRLWEHLTKKTPENTHSSTYIPLPHEFVVPGGRFQEIYYWDSYFTMLGLLLSKKESLVEKMIENFGYLIDNYGFIPNGNRTYFLSRSQPPFFSLMVDLLASFDGNKKPVDYLKQLEEEYNFWMTKRSVQMPNGEILNIYNDDDPTPRPESYLEDEELSHKATQASNSLYKNLRAACESGWDFSSRWLNIETDLGTISTTNIVPVDLNCLLFYLEKRLSELHPSRSGQYQELAAEREKAIIKYFWNQETGFFCDYDLIVQEPRKNLTLAGVFPLYFKIANVEQAKSIAQILKDRFLQNGGLLTTLCKSGQQWDAPNGWAPLQWISYHGLKNYNFKEFADLIKTNWLTKNEIIFKKYGKFTEKYDVQSLDSQTGGGEYPNQDGFGWTNGVYLSFKNEN
jgi:alpha,alpha-trehalase